MNQSIVLASSNSGKLHEFRTLFKDTGITITPQQTLGVTDAQETGLSFIENAILKARHASKATGLAAIADDSGLAIDALSGAPGIYSARFSGEHGNSAANNEKVLNALKDTPKGQRQGRFICVLAYLRHALDPCPIICQGRLEGEILTQAIGEGGFGYDPIVWLPAYQCSVAQLPSAEKNRISHRALALQQLVKQLSNDGNTP